MLPLIVIAKNGSLIRGTSVPGTAIPNGALQVRLRADTRRLVHQGRYRRKGDFLMRSSTFIIILLAAALAFVGYQYYVESQNNVKISVDPPSVEVN